jgi:hypothetical protein
MNLYSKTRLFRFAGSLVLRCELFTKEWQCRNRGLSLLPTRCAKSKYWSSLEDPVAAVHKVLM